MKHTRLQGNVLFVIMGAGAMGAPLLAPVRETLQGEAGLSRAELGMWIFFIGLAGGTAGLVLGIVMRKTARPSFFRAGAFLLALGCAFFAAVRPSPGRALLALGAGWFVVSLGRPFTASGNGIFADLWEASPHTGVIILHATNALGKLAAPLVVIALGTALARNAFAYAVFFGLFAVAALFWPRRSVEHLEQIERGREDSRALRLPKDPLVWACTAQFAFIAGSEAGATAILGSLVEKLRPAPFGWVPPQSRPAVAIAIMLGGIVAGRIVFAILSTRLSERAIIALCLACGFSAIPAAFSARPCVFLPALFLTGVFFSATWPAFFGLAARAYPAERTFLSFGSAFFNTLGISGCIYVASVIGNVESRLPHAFVASAAVMALFAFFLFLTPWGRRIGRPTANASS